MGWAKKDTEHHAVVLPLRPDSEAHQQLMVRPNAAVQLLRAIGSRALRGRRRELHAAASAHLFRLRVGHDSVHACRDAGLGCDRPRRSEEFLLRPARDEER